MDKMIHLAAQYLAAAGKSFVEHKADDSHTNLGFNSETHKLITHPLSVDGVSLSLSYDSFSLEFEGAATLARLELDGRTHSEVLQWLRERSDSLLNKPYTFDLHYDLPYSFDDNFRFSLNDSGRLQHLAALRTLANEVLTAFLKENGLKSEVRIWPHHFDTGAFIPGLDDTEVAIGLGMAIPDTVCDDYYFYISGYRGHEGIDTSSFAPLGAGSWKNTGFKGGVLPISGTNAADAVQFLNEALGNYRG